MGKTFTILLLLLSISSYAQSDCNKLLKTDYISECKHVFAANLMLTEKESDGFWPLYNQYEARMSEIIDMRLKLVREFAENYEGLTPSRAKEITKLSLKLEEKRFKLQARYIRKLEKVLPSIKVAQFLQIDNQLAIMAGLQITSKYPLLN